MDNMTTGIITESQRRAARLAGLAGLVTMATAVFATFVVYAPLIVPGNVAETARNITEHEARFRLHIALDLVYGAGVVVLLTALYQVFEPVSRGLAQLAALFRLLYALMWLVFALNLLHALRLLGGADYLSTLGVDRLQALARLDLFANSDAYYVGLPFYGLASTVCAWLWWKSKYIPRALAGLGVISSAWCVACAFAYIAIPHFDRIVNLWWFDSPLGGFELATSLWLLVKGLTPSAGERQP